MSQNAPFGLGLWFLKGALLGLESSHHSAVDHPVWSLCPHLCRRRLGPELSPNPIPLLLSTQQRLPLRKRRAHQQKDVSDAPSQCCEPRKHRHPSHSQIRRCIRSVGPVEVAWRRGMCALSCSRSSPLTASETSAPERSGIKEYQVPTNNPAWCLSGERERCRSDWDSGFVLLHVVLPKFTILLRLTDSTAASAISSGTPGTVSERSRGLNIPLSDDEVAVNSDVLGRLYSRDPVSSVHSDTVSNDNTTMLK